MIRKSHFFLSLVALGSYSAAYANVFWPAAFYLQEVLVITPIIFGLLIEALVIRHAARYSYGISFILSVLVNLASATVGTIIIVLFDLLAFIGFSVFIMAPINEFFNVDPFMSRMVWVLLTIEMIIISTLIEFAAFFIAYKLFFKKFGSVRMLHMFKWFLIGNTLSNIVAVFHTAMQRPDLFKRLISGSIV